MIRQAPVAVATTAAAMAATFLLVDRPNLWTPATTWLIHPEPRQFALDLAPWALAGLWIEPRIGSARFGLWTFAALIATNLAHIAWYPSHTHLFGVSAIFYTVCVGGLIAIARDRWWARAALALLALTLADELIRGENIYASTLPGGEVVSPAVGALEHVPLVHITAAALGVILGLVAHQKPRDPNPSERSRDSRRSSRAWRYSEKKRPAAHLE